MKGKVTEMDLYDFAKQVLNGQEPTSVIFLEGDKQTIKSIVNFDSKPDLIPSVSFSYTDLFTDTGSINRIKLDFPGLT
jgi:hypothetical protein